MGAAFPQSPPLLPAIQYRIHYRNQSFLRIFEADSHRRHRKMDKLIELSQTEIELAFASFCIEGTARRLGIPYQEVFSRMKRVGMIENYILLNYDILHTESREHVIDNMIECLTTWETNL